MLGSKPSIYSFLFHYLSYDDSYSFRLEETRAELNDERAKSTSDKLLTEGELANLRTR